MKRYVVARTDEVEPGSSKLVSVAGREIAVFNVHGEFFALANRCPHESGPLCLGKIVGLAEADRPGQYRLSRPGEFVKCPWHGWEFEIRTGQSWCDPTKIRARAYDASVENGSSLAKGPYVAETFAVSIDQDYITIEM
jgi:nitrite reductase/ring-hydroxylating ferredoxin subunit